MAVQHQEAVTEAARRIRQCAASPFAEVMGRSEGRPQEFCRLALIDAIEEATGFEVEACQAGRIADAVLKLMRAGRMSPGLA